MNLIDFSVSNPVKVAVGVILAVLFGAISYFATPVRLTPEVIEPEITVTTMWPGASPQEIEREIIEEQEEQLKSVEGLREFKSESTDSLGTIVLKFEVGTDLGVAQAKVRDKLNQVPEYPADAKEPTITTVNPTANAVAWFILRPMTPTQARLEEFAARHPETAEALAPMISGKRRIEVSHLNQLAHDLPVLRELLEGREDPMRMRRFAQDEIESRFERVEGVANANVFGGQEVEFRVTVDPVRLAAHRLTVAELRRALREQNKNTSGGDIWEGKVRNVIRTLGQYDTPEAVGETVVAVRDGKPILVKDVAEVGLGYRKPDGVVRQKGLSGLAVNAQQGPGSNLIELMGPPRAQLDLDGDGEITALELNESKLRSGDNLRIAAEELNMGKLKERGLELEQVYDQTEYLESAKSLVTGNIWVGGTLAVLVLLTFLRSWRSVAVIGLAIPLSVVATFLFMRIFGRSINVISLAGMAFAVGMVVDNSIVVLENIYRHYQEGAEPEAAVRKGTNEVWGAVLASTLTTVAVFIPVIFLEGQAGQLFRDISIAIACSVSLSMIVAITVVPTAAHLLLGPHASGGSKPSEWSFSFFGAYALAGRIVAGFARALQAVLRVRHGDLLIRVGIVSLFVAGSVTGAWILRPQTEYLPEGNRNLVIGILLPPPGYNVDQMIRLGEIIEQDLSPYWEAEPGSPEERALKGPRVDSFFFVARGRSLFMGAKSAEDLRAAELIPVLRNATRNVPGVIPIVSQASLFDNALSSGRSIDVEVTGPDLETLVNEAQVLFGRLMGAFPMDQGNFIQPVPGLDLSSPELHVVPIAERAKESGLSANELGDAVDALVDGAYAGDYWHDGTKIDLVIYGADRFSKTSQDVGDLPIATPAGTLVRLSDVAAVTFSSGPEQVNHSERIRTVTLRLKPGPAIALGSAMRTVDGIVREHVAASPTFQSGSYGIRLAGTADKLDQTWIEVQGILALALVITYLLMAGLFESFFHPLVVMTSVALALIGGFGGLALVNLFTHQALDMLTMLGFVILIGTVVNNPILIVHQALNLMREEGLEPRAAVVESTRTRIRPIMMTTVTTVLGMLPLVVPVPSFAKGHLEWVAGAGSELYRGLGAVVLGGLIVSTAFTLVLIPVGFTLAVDLKDAAVRLVLASAALVRRLLPGGRSAPDASDAGIALDEEIVEHGPVPAYVGGSVLRLDSRDRPALDAAGAYREALGGEPDGLVEEPSADPVV